MCLTIPGRVLRVEEDPVAGRVARVDFEGAERTASLIFLPEVRPGEYILVQAGIAIARVPAEEAVRTLEIARRPLEAPAAGTL